MVLAQTVGSVIEDRDDGSQWQLRCRGFFADPEYDGDQKTAEEHLDLWLLSSPRVEVVQALPVSGYGVADGIATSWPSGLTVLYRERAS